jgi:6-phosphogluconolactonase (cycloisomerase 2 family)
MRMQPLILTALITSLALFPAMASGEASSSATSASLTFVEAHFDLGLVRATSVAPSPDGKHLYLASYYNHAVSVFSVDGTSGKLTFVEMEQDDRGGVDGLSGASSVAVSPDGKHVYVTGTIDDAVVVFSRDGTTGALAYVEMEQNGVGDVFNLGGATSVAVSPDGKHVYVASEYDNALVIFNRDSSSGALSYVGARRDGSGDVNGLDTASSVAVSPDGNHVYATGPGDNAVAIFSRESTSGQLTYVDWINWGDVGGLHAANSVAVSPDGSHVYVASIGSSAVVVFDRNASTGALTHVETEIDGQGGVDGLDWAWSVTVSPDGGHVYVAGWHESAIAVFSRDASSGALTYVEVQRDGVGGVDGLDGPRSVAVSPGGEYVYVAGHSEDAVAAFSRDGITGRLTFIQARHSFQGLEGAVGVAASPDGSHVYVAGNNDDSVVVFARNAGSGALSYVERQSDGGSGGSVDGLDGARAVALSPDGKHLYVAGHDEDAVAVFERDQSTGELGYVETQQNGTGVVDGLDGAQSLTVSPDGKHVYVASEADDALAIFRRDGASGTLSYVGLARDGAGGVDGLGGAYAVIISPEGGHAYVAGYVDNAVALFTRNASSGVLTFVEAYKDGAPGIDGLNGANALALSSDGSTLYVAGRKDHALAVFGRDASSGVLTFLEVHKDGMAGVDGLYGARAVGVNPDGGQVYVAGQWDDALAVFSRDASTGALTFLEVHKDGRAGVDGLDTADGVAVSPEGGHVYVTGYDDNALAVFRRFAVYLPVVLRNYP